MGWLILAAVLLLAGLAVLFVGKVTYESDYREKKTFAIRWIGVAILALGLITVALDSYVVVPTRNIACQTAFGKPVGTLDNGFHWIRPWSSVQDFDATIQTLKLSADKDDNGEPITVRLANSTLATVDVTIQWRIDPHADITQLCLDYRTFDNIGTNVVRRQLSAALNNTFETYDPLATLKGGKVDPAGTLAALAVRSQEELGRELPKGIYVNSILIPKVKFADDIEAKISQYNAAVAETKIAEQRQKTAEATKIANDYLAKGANTPGVLYQNCLDLMERLAKAGVTPWPSFSCGTPPTAVVPVK